MKQDRTWTMSIPAAGRKYYNIGRNAAYRAARPYEEAQPGEIPCVDVGGLKRAVVSRLERMLSDAEDK